MTTTDRIADLRCAPWTLAQEVDPVGSAPRFDALLLVECPLPWPKDVAEIESLSAAAADPRAMVMAVVPRQIDRATVRVVHYRRVGPHRLAGIDHQVAVAEVPDLLARLLDDLGEEHLDWPSVVGPSPTDVLVCGHGKRDACCGRWGTLLQAELDARLTDVRVWRCSHTGGHRFAPTAITLPEGRAWAFADADLLEGVLERTGALPTLLRHDRGTSALDPWAQAAERAVFGHIGWRWLDTPLLDTSTTVAPDGQSAAVSVTWTDPAGAAHRAAAGVAVTRIVPVLVCGQPPEAAAKSSLELSVTTLEVDGDPVSLPARP